MLEFLILTAARSGEVRMMTWDEIDFAKAVWTIPASRMKAKVAHRVPLSTRAITILESRQSKSRGQRELVFPSRKDTPISDMTLTKFLRDRNVQSDIAGRVVTAHGFRSSFRDWASEHGYPRDLAERALAHTVRKVVSRVVV
jgi:integrase